jgi:hypothetical protein
MTPRYVIQVSDRRLSRIDRRGRVHWYTDDLNKAILLVTHDSFSAITYHGIGMDHTRLRTDDWLVGKLTELKPADKPLTTILESLKSEASKWIADISFATTLDLRHLRHSFLMSGWHSNARPFVFLVSNYEDLKLKERVDVAWDEFRATFSRPKLGKDRAYRLMARGDTSGLPMSDSELIGRLVQTPGAKPDDIVNVLVRSLRYAAGVSSTVSPECLSVVIEKGQHMANCKYHGVDVSPVIHAPHYVGPFTMSHVKIIRGKPTAE